MHVADPHEAHTSKTVDQALHELRTHAVEMDSTSKIFTNPSKKATEDYITGRYG